MNEDEKYDLIFNSLLNGTIDDWERLAEQFPDFPHGYSRVIDVESLTEEFPNVQFTGDAVWYWINEAIDCGQFEAVKWMIDKGVNLRFRDGEGYMPLHCCLYRDLPDKYEMLQLLIDSGADINAGTDVENGMMANNSWTPLHLAAVRGDLEAIRILLDNGADTTLRTIIDNYATAEEEAEHFGHKAAAELIRTCQTKAK